MDELFGAKQRIGIVSLPYYFYGYVVGELYPPQGQFVGQGKGNLPAPDKAEFADSFAALQQSGDAAVGQVFFSGGDFRAALRVFERAFGFRAA